MYFRLVGTLFLLGALSNVHAQGLLENGEQLHQLMRDNWMLPAQTPDLSKLRVAVIDEGFEGFDRYKKSEEHLQQFHKNIGSTVKLINLHGEEPSAGYQNSKHGFGMAQIFMAASGAFALPKEQRPEVLLLPATGFTEFARAVKYCLGDDSGKRRVDLIVHSRIFEWGSNFKGDGFFNAVVQEATQAGILWINSVGNNGGAVYFSNKTTVLDLPTKNKRNRIVALPGPNNTLLFDNKFDDQIYKITLSWNEFRSDADYATKKDLDFSVLSATRKKDKLILVEGGLGIKKQIGRHIEKGDKGVSGNAFEEVTLELKNKGLYAIRIYARSKNIEPEDQFQLRIISMKNPTALNFKHQNTLNEIMAPADRKDVIAVGTRSWLSARGSPGGIAKPDVILDFVGQDVMFQYSDSFQSGLDTSSAAAMYGGIVSNLMAIDPAFSPQKLIKYLQAQQLPSEQLETEQFPSPQQNPQLNKPKEQIEESLKPAWYWPL